MKALFKRLWTDEQGQSTTEYILILAVVVMIAMKFKKEFGSRMSNIIDKVGGEIDSSIDN
jgi:Flp pilus assembly pilin Flp